MLRKQKRRVRRAGFQAGLEEARVTRKRRLIILVRIAIKKIYLTQILKVDILS